MMVIAAVRNEQEMDAAIQARAKLIFCLNPNILTLEETVRKVHDAGKKIFLHMDLAEGVGKDKAGLIYVKKAGVDGVISTRVNIIKAAKDVGLFCIQRFFIVDSHSIDTTIESVKSSRPDMVEIMPGIISKVICELKAVLNIPVIAGGLIETRQEIEEAARSGATAVSTSRQELWGRKEKA